VARLGGLVGKSSTKWLGHAIAAVLQVIDLARIFVGDAGSHRCFKLLVAWLLPRGASYNCRLPREN
ncbi:hypothetical protein ACEPT7_26335, partial [Burkholderia ubonensis]|uniref:hypothetical protein n=1 Tax=Burkholderia ubonensis TaxID=101571 RepID=UPI0035902EAD